MSKYPCIWRGAKAGCCFNFCHAYLGAHCSDTDPNAPHYCGACSKREAPEEQLKPADPPPMPSFQQTGYAPIRGQYFDSKPWEGPNKRKPWEYKVTLAIPVLDSAESVEAIVKLYSLQTEKPYVCLVDTGSVPEQLARLNALQCDWCEVHSLKLNGVRHPSDFPAIAMDLAFSACRTEYLLATHADCFPMRKDLVAFMLSVCDYMRPVAGYELTERPHSDWRGMVGHTLTMFHIPTMDHINAYWSLRRLVTTRNHPDGKAADWTINPATSPNWPDTELLVNYQIRERGITPVIVGKEYNAQRTTDDKIDHCRSWASARLYNYATDYQVASDSWLADGIRNAYARAQEWSNGHQ